MKMICNFVCPVFLHIF